MTPAALSNNLSIALVGNPNTGKSTLFNRLTGVRQRVGNYPGVTVERKSGQMKLGDTSVTLVDLPGTYSLAAASPDERVVVDALLGNFDGMEKPDAVLCVLDATNLSRNLFLASQVADLGLPIVLVLNLADSARDQEIAIDHHLLAVRFGVPVVSTVATSGAGLDDLREALESAIARKATMTRVEWPPAIEKAASELRDAAQRATGHVLNEAEAHRMLFDAESSIPHRIGWAATESAPAIASAREHLRDAHIHPFAAETMLRYAHIGKILEGAVQMPEKRKGTASESIDALLTHRVWGLAIFAGMMLVVFQSVYSWAAPFMDLIDTAKGWVQETLAPALAATPMLQSLLLDGVVEGVGSVLIFLPQIMILFAFIAILEDTGYMARAAFLMDKLLAWCGLNGKSFVPLLSSYACAVPGVLSTRTIEDPKARLVTILIAPLMSCSARLPVYVLLIGAFVEPAYGPWIAGIALFAMHFLGLACAIPIAWILNRFVLRTKPQPFLLEMPPYRVPKVRDVAWRIWERSREFLIRAGTVIFAITVIVWALLYFPRPADLPARVQTEMAGKADMTEEQFSAALSVEENEWSPKLEHRIAGAYVEQSYMGRAGRAIQPIFAPAGFDWKITVGVLSSFPAREVIIATLGIIYNLGGDVDEASGDLRSALKAERWPSGPLAGTPIFTLPVAFAIMVFFALCLQCGATVSVIAKESSWKWAIFAFVYMTTLAWLGAMLVNQLF